MKKLGNNLLLILFCIGIIAGLILPRWFSVNSSLDFRILNIHSFRQYMVVKTDYAAVIQNALRSRLTLMLLLFFSCFTAAGFWILAGVFLVMGLFLGLILVMSVVQLNYWGIAFLLCAIFPQWLFYGAAGEELGRFVQKRKKPVLNFLKISLLTCCGIAAEVYLNPWLLRYFLNFYLSRLS